MTQHPDVVVIGDALLDVTAHPETPIRSGQDVAARIRIGCGGQGANLAVRLARRGVRTELVCALGDDPGEELVRDALAAEGVEVSAIRTGATGTVVILLDERGERTMLSQRAPFAAGAAAAVRDGVAWLVVSGYLLLEPDSVALASALAMKPAHRALVGCTVPDALAGRWVEGAAAMRPDLVVLNRDEALAIPGVAPDGDELPARLGERLGSAVFVTDPFGATAQMNGVSTTVRAPTSPPATDTTGAGDAFAAALVGSLMESRWPPAAEALEDALAASIELASAVAHASGAQARVAGERDAILRK
ncbi:MAG TPA: carbohydrate kinase family protein [Candidatus Limnocylindrales bacterium]|nr:carbohydrate kinase family protein [Candidatus Limnocylindrales bacterium]